MEPLALQDGRLLQVHNQSDCYGPNCCIHNPSDHPLRNAPLTWYPGVGMMRVCEHDYIHPDPDDLAVKLRTHGIIDGLALLEAISSVHLVEENCDGCCERKET